MKFIGKLQGAAGFRESVEEYSPEKGVDSRELIELVKSTYDFQIFPTLTPGAPMPPVLTFGGGRLLASDGSIAISNLFMSQEGDVAICADTDLADLVLNSLIALLDDNLDYRLRESQKAKSYLSNIVVQFDKGLEGYINKLSSIAGIINSKRGKESEFNIKRIGFGPVDMPHTPDPLSTIEAAEFLIERRAGRPFSENRYFCSAPFSIGDHLAILERIEATISTGSN